MTRPTAEVWLVVIGFTLVVTTVALVLVRPMLRRRGMVDKPNHRSSHSVPTLRGGGIGVLVGLLAGWISVALIVGPGAQSTNVGPLATAFVVVFLFGAVGWLEDCYELSVRSRLIAQCAIAAVATVALARTTTIPTIAVALVVPIIVFYVNVANFMDGINGISAQHGVVVAAYFGLLAYYDGAALQALAACVLGCAFLSFFPWNVRNALMFLGDSGSYVLGAASAVLAIWAMTRQSDALVLIAPLLIYISDVTYTLARRIWRRDQLLTAHREHIYQRLQRATASHSRPALLVTTMTCLCSGMGMLVVVQPALRPVWYAGAVAIIGLYFASPRWILYLSYRRTRQSEALLLPRARTGGPLSPSQR